MMTLTTVKRHYLKVNHLTVIGKKHLPLAASVTLAVHTHCFRNTIEVVLLLGMNSNLDKHNSLPLLIKIV